MKDYQIIKKIHESQNSLVYRAINALENKPVIIKRLKESYPSPSELLRYQQEYDIVRSLDIYGVIKSHDLQRDENSLILVLEDFGGESLKLLMSDFASSAQSNRQFTLREFLYIAIETTESLAAIHACNIIHKDINPSNIIYNRETQQIKIIDFGISTRLSRENQAVENPNSLEGTLAYIAPEQTGRMNRGVDYRSDFYSLGATFYELLTERLPFAASDPIELVHCHLAQQPIPPHELVETIPKAISDIVMKLLAKTPEERYQNALGIKADLEHCLERLETLGEIPEFPLATQDICDRFIIPEKLYGREKDVAQLLEAFERVSCGNTEIVLVSGYSGIGKSALVHEVQKPLVRQRGYFIGGKFDQLNRDIPYAAFSQAFKNLVQQLLTESEEALESWKAEILEALEPNARVIVDVIPELESLIGEQPLVEELGAIEAQNRFNLFFQKFLNIFTQKERPLVIFLDDLQWADLASLKLIELLTTYAERQYLLLIGAYRDNEVDATHPLTQTLSRIKEKETRINRIDLQPLALENIRELVSDTLNSTPEHSQELAELVAAKTQGNPFFLIQLLQSLHQENLLSFDVQQKGWCWNIEEIERVGITDNVIDLTVRKIAQLDKKTQNILKLAACIGNQFDLEILSAASEHSQVETARELQPALEQGLVLPLSKDYKIPLLGYQEFNINDNFTEIVPKSISYKFLHDRVQQAAYSLIDGREKKSVHLKIGRILLKNTSQDKFEENIFDLVNQLNEGSDLIVEQSEKDNLARLNLLAGKKAKASTAYQTALRYSEIGLGLLDENAWKNNYQLTLELFVEKLEVLRFNSQYEQVKELAVNVLSQAQNNLDKFKAYEALILSNYATLNNQEAIEFALTYLEQLGISLPKNTKEIKVEDRIQEAQNQVESFLKGQPIQSLKNLPLMSDPEKIVATEILQHILTATTTTNFTLHIEIALMQLFLSIEYGNAPCAPSGYGYYGALVCGIMRDIETAYQYGKLSLELQNLLKVTQQEPFVAHFSYNCIFHWKEFLRDKDSLENFLKSYQNGIDTGNNEYASYLILGYCLRKIFAGYQLDEINNICTTYTQALHKMNIEYSILYMSVLHKIAKNLLYESENRLKIFDEDTNEKEDSILESWRVMGNTWLLFIAHLCIEISCYVFKDYTRAYENGKLAENYVQSCSYLLPAPQHTFYYSLSCLACYGQRDAEEQENILEVVARNQQLLKTWVNNCSINFKNKYELIEAEKARVLGQTWQAKELYEKAIKSSKESEFIHEEAFAYERAAEFYLSLGREEFGQLYLRNAYHCYRQWGASAKVKQLEEEYPQYLLGVSESSQPGVLSTRTSTTGSDGKGLDLNTIVKASQTISGEISLEKLLQKLMKIVIENAGAQKGLLLLETASHWMIEAEGAVDLEKIRLLRSLPIDAIDPERQTPFVPTAIINYVARTQESIVLNDATAEGQFINDPYILAAQPKSVLCAPILNQGKLSGIVYLENNLTTGAFTADRLTVLSILSAQASISIENAQLYQNLEQKVQERTAELAQANQEISLLNERLKAENMRMSTELEIARRLQQILLPKPAELEAVPGVDIAGFMEPAEEVGGDYYDVLPRNQGVIIGIGDVTGHGLESGVLTIVAQTAIRTLLTHSETDPVKFLQTVNQTLFDNVERMNSDKNMTLSLLEYQNQSLRLSGQHEELIVVRSGGEVERIDTVDLGFPIGLEPDIADFIASTEIALNLGDVVVLYTDGITEAFDVNNVAYGIDRLIEVVVQNRSRSAAEIKQAVIDDLRRYIGEQKVFDDITLVIIKQR